MLFLSDKTLGFPFLSVVKAVICACNDCASAFKSANLSPPTILDLLRIFFVFILDFAI